VSRVYDALIRAAADRATTLIAAGGGVVGDIAGFAAATYLRGDPVVQVPTTLLAQVDSAIGGKVGVNHPLGKNLDRRVSSAGAVVIDPDLLGTLPRREFRAGLYEVVKYGVIASRPCSIGGRLAQGALRAGARRPVPVIAECCRIKAAVVGRGRARGGPAAGAELRPHAGHALEAVTKYRRFRHGEAVAYGMRVAAEVGVVRGLLRGSRSRGAGGADRRRWGRCRRSATWPRPT
jgi:3-dehydroquinate synthase